MANTKGLYSIEAEAVFGLSAINKYQLSLTNPRDALHHHKRGANKGGRSV